VTGRSIKRNNPVTLTVNAPDHAAAVRIASNRKMVVDSCVLVTVGTMPPASVLGRQVCEPRNDDQQLFDAP
jgi:hypothetical protein